MNPPRETLHLEPSVQATHPAYSGRRGVAPEDKSALRKAAKVAWNAAPPFPVASDAELWGKALAAALRTNSILDAALTLAQQGVPVFPVSPVGQKKPLNAHGVYSATTDLAVVEREFRRDIEPLIAVPMGRRTGVFAIDIDASPPHAHDGVAAWQALEEKRGGGADAHSQNCERGPSPAVPLAAGTSRWLRCPRPAERHRMQGRRRRDRLSALGARRRQI